MAEAARYTPTPQEAARLEHFRARAIIGTGERVEASLTALAEAHGLDDIAILTTAHDPIARQASYREIAAASALRGQTRAAA